MNHYFPLPLRKKAKILCYVVKENIWTRINWSVKEKSHNSFIPFHASNLTPTSSSILTIIYNIHICCWGDNNSKNNTVNPRHSTQAFHKHPSIQPTNHLSIHLSTLYTLTHMLTLCLKKIGKISPRKIEKDVENVIINIFLLVLSFCSSLLLAAALHHHHRRRRIEYIVFCCCFP